MSHSSAALRLEPNPAPVSFPVIFPVAPAEPLTNLEQPLTIFEVPQPKTRSMTLLGCLGPFLQKFGGMQLTGKDRRMRVSETVNLGEKRFVSLIEIDGVSLLIGGGSGGVQLLTQLDKGTLPRSFKNEIDSAWRKRGTA